MTWSYLKRGVSTDHSDLLWKMHNDYVENVVKRPCCTHMSTKESFVHPLKLMEHDVDNTTTMFTISVLLLIGFALLYCKK